MDHILTVNIHLPMKTANLSNLQAAVDSITRGLALEWGTDYDIRVNGIAPGPIAGTAGLRKLVPEEMKSKIREEIPLFRMGDKWDIAMAAIYLASDAGIRFIFFLPVILFDHLHVFIGGFRFRVVFWDYDLEDYGFRSSLLS